MKWIKEHRWCGIAVLLLLVSPIVLFLTRAMEEEDIGYRALILLIWMVLPLIVLTRAGYRFVRRKLAAIEAYRNRLLLRIGMLLVGAAFVIAPMHIGVRNPFSVQTYLVDLGDDVEVDSKERPLWHGTAPGAVPWGKIGRAGGLLFAVPIMLLPAMIALTTWMLSQEDGLNDRQRRRAAQVAKMEESGQRFPWSWPAAFLMGFYSLRKRIWWGFGRAVWNSLWMRIWFPTIIILNIVALSLSSSRNAQDAATTVNAWGLLIAIAAISLQCGSCFHKWMFIYRGEHPSAGFDPSIIPPEPADASAYRVCSTGLSRFVPPVRLYVFGSLLFLLFNPLGASLCVQVVESAELIGEPSPVEVRIYAEDGRFFAESEVSHRTFANFAGLQWEDENREDFNIESSTLRVRLEELLGKQPVFVLARWSHHRPYLWRVAESGEVDLDINAELIRRGLARAESGHPREEEFRKIEAEARAAMRGGWKDSPIPRPDGAHHEAKQEDASAAVGQEDTARRMQELEKKHLDQLRKAMGEE